MLKSSFVHKLQTRNGRVIILARQIRVLPGYKWDPVTSRNSSTINVLLCLKLNTNERKIYNIDPLSIHAEHVIISFNNFHFPKFSLRTLW